MRDLNLGPLDLLQERVETGRHDRGFIPQCLCGSIALGTRVLLGCQERFEVRYLLEGLRHIISPPLELVGVQGISFAQLKR